MVNASFSAVGIVLDGTRSTTWFEVSGWGEVGPAGSGSSPLVDAVGDLRCRVSELATQD